MNEIDALAEIEAMKAVAQALQPLDDDSRRRVVGWVSDKFLGVAAPRRATPQKESPPELENNGNGTPQNVARQGGRSLTDFQDVAEAYHACAPSTDAEKALVLGGWLQQVQQIDGLDSFRINSELKHLGYGIGNITRALEYLIGAKPALMLQLRKSGTSRQARKTYRVTDAGLKKISQMLTGGEAA
jgi:hypothetical protein